MKQTTPLPWEAYITKEPFRNAIMHDGTIFAEVHGTDYRRDPADAAYIVHACNTYPQLVADRARLIAALQKTNELVARGHVEGAYNAIAAGPQYAERVMAATASLLRELGEG